MFKIFSFNLNDILNSGNLQKIGGIMSSFLDGLDIDLDEISKVNQDKAYSDIRNQENNNFIMLNRYNDMYRLIIDLKGIDIRELSIRYDPGIIDVNLNRMEIQNVGFGILSNNVWVKKSYNKKFEDIEDIDTNQILKIIDNGILSIMMQKKYSNDILSKTIDVDYYDID